MSQALTAGTILKGKAYTYTIEKVLGQGSFGITYLASFPVPGSLGEITAKAAVKEFFAKEFDTRLPNGSISPRAKDGMAIRYARAFQRESENLSKMKHPGIIKVLEAFEANGTYYYSMDYLAGGSLDEKVTGWGMSEEEALPMISKIADALSYMHSRKMIHLDLKPKNIMLNDDGAPVIIDFGLSKLFDDKGKQEYGSSIGLGTPGYAPIEQAAHTAGKSFQPTLDIYALGATYFKMLTGSTPPSSHDIFEDGFPEKELQEKQLSEETIDVIRKTMSPSRKDRPQNVEEFLNLLKDEEGTLTKGGGKGRGSGPVPDSGSSVPKPKSWLWWLLGGLAAVAIAVACYFAFRPDPDAGWVDLGLPSGTLWKDGNEVGFFRYDEALDLFGDTLPTEDQILELKNSCLWTWTGSGYRVVGPSGKLIELPANGWRDSDGQLNGRGTTGRYWSSTPTDDDNAQYFFTDPKHYYMTDGDRSYGRSVRLVRVK